MHWLFTFNEYKPIENYNFMGFKACRLIDENFTFFGVFVNKRLLKENSNNNFVSKLVFTT